MSRIKARSKALFSLMIANEENVLKALFTMMAGPQQGPGGPAGRYGHSGPGRLQGQCRQGINRTQHTEAD